MPTWNKAKQHQQKIKAEVISQYGGICKCCGEDRLIFLVIDHVAGNGTQERLKVGRGTTFYRWLKRNEFPTGYQVLCHNCNFAKHFGVCPHQVLEP